ncbi:zinc-binding oxidoreductase-like protein CipB [Cadophora sp. MPI-SDFR-AT-0126]|nr:zinc-binding oxidoreductase-like protein CipB [Leotiomycetes sp. MPI-SDFR-AT-0126]
MPTNYPAYLVEAKSFPLEIREAPYPSPEPNTVVIRSHAVAINPFILGSDAAGEVVEAGSGVTNVAKGAGTGDSRYSAFQEYTIIPANALALLPASISFEQGAVLPLAEDHLNIPLPSDSSVGTASIQLAKASGFEVISTASAHNHQLVKSLGASEIFDHGGKSVVDDIVIALRGKRVVGAFDCISDVGTQKACADILLKTKAANNGRFKPAPQALVVGTGLGFIQEALEKNKADLSAAKVVVKLVPL